MALFKRPMQNYVAIESGTTPQNQPFTLDWFMTMGSRTWLNNGELVIRMILGTCFNAQRIDPRRSLAFVKLNRVDLLGQPMKLPQDSGILLSFTSIVHHPIVRLGFSSTNRYTRVQSPQLWTLHCPLLWVFLLFLPGPPDRSSLPMVAMFQAPEPTWHQEENRKNYNISSKYIVSTCHKIQLISGNVFKHILHKSS